MKFIADKRHFNQAVNLDRVSAIYLSNKPSKTGKHYIRFIIDGKDSDVFWLYDKLEDRNFVFDNYILPLIEFIGIGDANE